MTGLLNFLLGRKADFFPYEIRIIEAVKAHVDDESGSRLQRQVEAINKIQRLADGKEVNLYQMRHGKPAFDDSLRFPNAEDEALLASASLVNEKTRAKLKVEVWLAKGRLFSLVFNKSPKQFFAGDGLKSMHPEVVDVKVWFNPMHARSVSAVARDVVLTGWPERWHANSRIVGLYPPLSQSERSAFLGRIDALLPPDYLELVMQSEGVVLAACVVNGVASIRKVVSSEENHYVLAEIEGRGVLAVRDGSRDALLYFLDYEDNDARPLGSSFEKALVDLLKVDAPAPGQG